MFASCFHSIFAKISLILSLKTSWSLLQTTFLSKFYEWKPRKFMIVDFSQICHSRLGSEITCTYYELIHLHAWGANKKRLVFKNEVSSFHPESKDNCFCVQWFLTKSTLMRKTDSFSEKTMVAKESGNHQIFTKKSLLQVSGKLRLWPKYSCNHTWARGCAGCAGPPLKTQNRASPPLKGLRTHQGCAGGVLTPPLQKSKP